MPQSQLDVGVVAELLPEVEIFIDASKASANEWAGRCVYLLRLHLLI